MIFTYLLFIIPLLILANDFRVYQKNKKTGFSTTFQPLQTVAMVILILIALVGIITGKTFEDITSYFN